jgi:uroporphyrinogen decarboxylase
VGRASFYDAAVVPRLIRACRREAVDVTPVWFMRQSGRYLPEYQRLRRKHTLAELCRDAGLAAAVTLQPLRHLDVDAAIVFSDVALPLEPMGLPLETLRPEQPPTGPEPHRGLNDLNDLRVYDPNEDLPVLADSVRLVRAELGDRLPVIGFVGAPFTLACYAVEGRDDGRFARTRSLMREEPAAWHRLAEKLATVASRVALAQVDAGAEVIQVFDSWVGVLSPAEYRTFVRPHATALFGALAERCVPTIHYGPASPDVLREMSAAGGDVIGVDWRVPLDEAWDAIGHDRAVMGNLDPGLLLGRVERLLAGAAEVLDRAQGRPGHIFNLGHGILPTTPLERVQALVRYVHTHTRS